MRGGPGTVCWEGGRVSPGAGRERGARWTGGRHGEIEGVLEKDKDLVPTLVTLKMEDVI